MSSHTVLFSKGSMSVGVAPVLWYEGGEYVRRGAGRVARVWTAPSHTCTQLVWSRAGEGRGNHRGDAAVAALHQHVVPPRARHAGAPVGVHVGPVHLDTAGVGVGSSDSAVLLTSWPLAGSCS